MNQVKIRPARSHEIEQIAEIEALSFPAAEAASEETFIARFEAFPGSFLVAEYGGAVIGFINGCGTSSLIVYDDLYHGTSHHEPNGPNLAIFGVDVHPAYRRRGIAGDLIRAFIDKATKDGRKAIILTCKENLIHYYASFGFTSSGISASTHGGAVWYDMILTL